VIHALHSTGSSDPDVLFARKQELTSPAGRMKRSARTQILVGSVASLTGVGMIVGIPLILGGLRELRQIDARVAAIESAFESYVKDTEQSKHSRRSEISSWGS
jgi:hypothetical protein